jgi:acetyl esterase/lipase
VTLLTGCAGLRIRDAKSQVRIEEDVPYAADGEPRHRLDLYLPRSTERAPVVVFVHGGFWRSQDRRYWQAFTGIYGNVGVTLAKQGIAVAIPSYRLSPGAGIRQQLEDVTAAIRWTSENIARYGADPRKLVLAGYSAGGHLVTFLTLHERIEARGCVSVSGVVDLPLMAREQKPDFNEDVTYRLFGRTTEAQAQWSPSTFARADAPPLFFLAAERDYGFVREGGQHLATRTAELGGRATYEEIPSIDHADMVLDINTSKDRVSDRIARFVHEVTADQ